MALGAFRLTDRALRGLKPQARAFKVSDGQGLHVLVTPAGSRLWRGKYRLAGRERQLALGAYPEVSLHDAREAWHQARRALREGIDPGRASEPVKRAATFAEIAREWHAANRARWKPHYAADVLQSLEGELFPTLGASAADQITPPTLLAALRRVEHRGAVETAHRLRQRASGVFAYGIAAGLCTTNPAAALVGA
ncbi:MAG: tyrosine-type recombinase/integrase, partial [Acetobacteraceae bacterium]